MFSLCLTNYNRYEMLIEAFQHVYDDPRISEIIISDDCSDKKIFDKLFEYCKGKSKIRLHRNATNVGMSMNKRNAVFHASNPWCILFDSDNILTTEYIDAIPKILSPVVIYCPEFAKPSFDYRKHSGKLIHSLSIKKTGIDDKLNMLLNTCNYLVNRDRYLDTYEYNEKIKASDTIHFNYLWLKSAGAFYVLPEMQYFHRVHDGSGFLQDVNYNMRMAEQTKQLIQQL